MCNYLISKEVTQKENHDKTHKTNPLPELYLRQDILFPSPSEPHTYLHGNIISPASRPRSYILEIQGRQYHKPRKHIHAINYTTTTTISRPHFQAIACNNSQNRKPGNSTRITAVPSCITRPHASQGTIIQSKQTANC